MTPATILNKLAEVRRRERLLGFVWGAARVAAVALALLVLCCFADWLIDRWTDTPPALRVLFLLTQLAVAAGLASWLVVLPAFMRLSDSTVATWVERAFPGFRHRLVTAVELNQPHAATAGMSPALIAAVTREAVQKSAVTDFRRAVDGRRLWWSGYVLAPVLLIALILLAIAPLTGAQLLGRQLLLPVDITRSVRFELQDVTTLPEENASDRDEPRPAHTDINQAAVCASGDRVAIRFKAAGRVNEKTRGTLRIHPTDGAAEDVPLEFEPAAADGQGVFFVAKVPASSVEFTYKAWLGDARLRQEGRVTFEARPTVESQKVAVLLPEYCGLRSNGTRFEQKADSDPKGEVVGLAGSTAVVTVTASKPLARAALRLISSQAGSPEKEYPMTLDDSGTRATGRFDLEAGQIAYRVVVWDRYGFVGRVSPRRGIAQLPDEPPIVSLLPERFIPEAKRYLARADDPEYDREGIPVLLGDSVRIAYRARSIAGLYGARLRYRINDAKDFDILPLTEYQSSPEVGAFELDRGIFEKIREDDRTIQIEFHAVDVKPGERDRVPPRREGGGRIHFQTARIPGLKVGDKLEFFIEVLDNRPEHLIGRSESRVKDVVSTDQILAWERSRRQEAERLNDLKKRQTEVFEPPAPTPMD